MSLRQVCSSFNFATWNIASLCWLLLCSLWSPRCHSFLAPESGIFIQTPQGRTLCHSSHLVPWRFSRESNLAGCLLLSHQWWSCAVSDSDLELCCECASSPVISGDNQDHHGLTFPWFVEVLILAFTACKSSGTVEKCCILAWGLWGGKLWLNACLLASGVSSARLMLCCWGEGNESNSSSALVLFTNLVGHGVKKG